MPVLHRAGASYLTVQAAVWIVTDNADYDELGTLQLGSSRAIGVDPTVQAMWHCEQAGIDIKKKLIWTDRAFLAKNVRDTKLKSWLTK